MIKAVVVSISGIVQGVGYRPFIHRTAIKYKVNGFVANKGGEVFIHAEGDEASVEAFLDFIMQNYPSGANILSIQAMDDKPMGAGKFEIMDSMEDNQSAVGIPVDMGMCDDCANDMSNPESRYYKYPLTSCTKCGPRLTIVRKLPYDRCNTAMEPFQLCSECEAEFKNPADRRYHAQTICCPHCGPEIKLTDRSGNVIGGDPFENAGEMLKKGMILGVKGIGGYHIICDAKNSEAVLNLRERKKREYKPLAVMFKDIDAAEKHCNISSYEREILLNQQKPIVLLSRKNTSDLSEMVNPGLKKLGAMLPYSGVHYLLFDAQIEALVATSGNISGLPLVTGDEDAKEYIGGVVDAFIMHNREIVTPCDDSVVSVIDGQMHMIRRARGYAPIPIILRKARSLVLACGSDFKNTFCMAKNGRAYVSQHIGDFDRYETLQVQKEIKAGYESLLNFKPELAACDMHPDYRTTQYAEGLGIPVIRVQHHHAHIASVLAENDYEQEAIGVALDGTGYGNDGTVWGGEFLIASLDGYERVGHFKNAAMPGGEAAALETWRMAGAYLHDAYGEEMHDLGIRCIEELKSKNWEVLLRSTQTGLNSLKTSSAGRLFDAVSAILGICFRNGYEGQAAAELEAIADSGVSDIYGFDITENEPLTVDFNRTIKGIVTDLKSGAGLGRISGKFHNTVAGVVLEMCMIIRKKRNLDVVALSGGVFQNRLLLEKVLRALKQEEFIVMTNSAVPCNDGGISLGQAAIAARKELGTNGSL